MEQSSSWNEQIEKTRKIGVVAKSCKIKRGYITVISNGRIMLKSVARKGVVRKDVTLASIIDKDVKQLELLASIYRPAVIAMVSGRYHVVCDS